MGWEDIIKKRKSKNIRAHNDNILSQMRFFEEHLKDANERLSIQGTSKMLSTYGRERQMKQIKYLKRKIQYLENRLEELRDRLRF